MPDALHRRGTVKLDVRQIVHYLTWLLGTLPVIGGPVEVAASDARREHIEHPGALRP